MILPLSSETPLRRLPYVTLSLIMLNVLINLLYALFPSPLSSPLLPLFDVGLVPNQLAQVSWWSVDGVRRLWTLVSHGFLHGGWMHLTFNVIFLYAFGCKIEDRLGHWRFALFYFVVLLCAGGSYAWWYAGTAQGDLPLIGASGAISGILGAYLLKFPHIRIRTFFWVLVRVWILRIPAYVLLCYWIALDVVSAATYSPKESRVAWAVHLFGLLFGLFWIGVMAGFRVESNEAHERTHPWRATLRSAGTMLKSDIAYTVTFFVLAPLLLWGMGFLASFVVKRPVGLELLGFQDRLRWAYYLTRFYLFPFVLLLGLIGGGSVAFWWWLKRQRQWQAIVDQEHCMLCHREGVQLIGDGFYQCHHCGFDTRIRLVPRLQKHFALFQDIRITERFLLEAKRRIDDEETQSALMSFDNAKLKESMDAFTEAVSLFHDLLAQHAPILETVMRHPESGELIEIPKEPSSATEQQAESFAPELAETGEHPSLVELSAVADEMALSRDELLRHPQQMLSMLREQQQLLLHAISVLDTVVDYLRPIFLVPQQEWEAEQEKAGPGTYLARKAFRTKTGSFQISQERQDQHERDTP